MIFLCGNCQAKYQLPDERVAGRTVRMKCRKCAHLIEVTGPSPEASTAAEPQGWYAGIDGKPTGPLSQDDLASKLEAGVITGETLVWREGLDGWKPLSEVAELSALVAVAPEAPSEPSPPEPEPAEAPRSEPVPSSVPRPSPPPSRPSPPRAVPSPRTSLVGAPAVARELEEEPSPIVPVSAPPAEKLAPPVVAAAEPTFDAPAPPPASLAEPSAEPPPPSTPTPASFTEEHPAPSEAVLSTAAALEATARESLVSAEPASLAAPLGGPPSAPPPPSPIEPIVTPPAPARSRVHPAAWALVGLGGVLVGVIAGLSLAKGPAAEAPVEQQPAAIASSSPEEPVASAEAPSQEEPPSETADRKSVV